MERAFKYICGMCGLIIDTSKCDYKYSPDQESINLYCPLCKDGTKMTPIKNKDNYFIPDTE